MAETDDSREKRLARERAWREANPERVKAHKRKWYEENREQVAASKRARRAANPDKTKEASRKNHAQQRAERPERLAYQAHKDSAKRRYIAFLLTFEEWWAIWEASGRWEYRGLGSDQYCMARYGDAGAYEVGNVRICTGRENRTEAHKGRVFSDTHRKALAKAWQKRRQRLPPLRTSNLGRPTAKG